MGMKTKKYVVKFNDQEIVVTKRRTSRLKIYVNPITGKAEVSVPFFTSKGTLRKFIADNLSFFDRQRKEEDIFLWGERYSLGVGEVFEDILIAELKMEVPMYLTKWEEVTGLKANEWRLKKMKSRWGTCNISAKRIWLNTYLAEKEKKCLDYVILHELLHLVESNHGKKFKDLLDKFMPDWRERERILKSCLWTN